jgi:CHAT domain-containing protein/Tfp pilus assembly protein PilF
LAAATQAGQDITMLRPAQVIERDLAHGQEHLYQLALTAGECVSVIVEQRGIDVIVQTRGPDDAVIADVQDEITRQGQEHVEVVADAAGTYTLAIKPPPGVIVPGSYAIRVASRRAATDADRSLQEARKLRTTAVQLYDKDELDHAAPLLERALTLTEGVRGPEDTQVADVAAQLANVYVDLPDNARAESLYQRALAIMDKTLGAEHPATAIVRSRLAKLYQLTGQRLKAEPLVKQALEVIEKTLGPDHLAFVRSLSTLASLRIDAGDVEQAEAIARRQLAIMEKIDYAESILYAGVLNNVGEIHGRQRDYAQAEAFLQRALALGEKLRGPDCWFITNPLNNLGIVAREQKQYAAAESYYRRALSIRERIAGPDNPDLGLLLVNLANIYHASGDYVRSLEAHAHALRIVEHAVGPYHQNTLLSVGNLARVNLAAGDVAKAIAFQRRADAILETQLALNLAIGSERQKLTFVSSMSFRTDRTISLHLDKAPADPDAGALAALVLLQRKGRVLDAMIDTFAAARQRVVDPRDQGLLDQLNTTIAQLARIALNAPQGAHPDPDARQTQIKELEARKERLEAELGDHDAEFRAQVQPVTLEAVQAAMPEEAALLEFAVFRPYDPTAERNAEAYAAPHYAAYVVRKDAAPRGVDLGPVKAIDEAIEALRQALRDPRRTDLQRRARAVDTLVMQPLRESLGGATRLLISPDGNLNLVPFDALVDEQGHYLIERYAINYLTSGRDLLRMQVTRASRSAPVILADPLFGEPAMPPLAQTIAQPAGTLARKPAQKLAPTLASARTQHRSITTGDDLSTLYFAPLAGTAEEAREIKALFPEATLLTGPRATKATLQRVEAPRMLHIASHGFFLREATGDAQPSPAAASTNGTRAMSATVKVENPLLRSGLALAGANLSHDQHDDGILTALEASGLNLWGTKLVTLSACDTGLGEVRNGEGVYGLRRAFVLAGADTLVMSLWPVSDYVTREIMTTYYTGLRAGLGRGDALRQAKLAMLRRKGRQRPFQHPFYWASFIQSGEWASLDGRR